jgi:hypothetical protein
VLVVIPVTIHLVTSDGALVIDAKALPLAAGPARAVTLKIIVAFGALTPPFDASKICQLAYALLRQLADGGGRTSRTHTLPCRHAAKR